jgi:hypothetical protein
VLAERHEGAPRAALGEAAARQPPGAEPDALRVEAGVPGAPGAPPPHAALPPRARAMHLRARAARSLRAPRARGATPRAHAAPRRTGLLRFGRRLPKPRLSGARGRAIWDRSCDRLVVQASPIGYG